MVVELLRPAGPTLARRWLAALLLAPESDRPAIVQSVEQRLAETYGARAPTLPAAARQRARADRARRRAG
ncbi:MAG: hypothetical protein IBJ10_00970 [Phycisphaerales bacterium]|nr:hypothetical protein [Phycisphaerales bacterium]